MDEREIEIDQSVNAFRNHCRTIAPKRNYSSAIHCGNGRNIFYFFCLLLSLIIAASADAAICRRLDGDRAIRRAVRERATIIISSRGTFANCEMAQPAARISPVAQPQPLTIRFQQQSATVPEADEAPLEALARRAVEAQDEVEITAWAFSSEAPATATRLAHARAVALRNALLGYGATPDRLRIRAFGGRQGEDRVEINSTRLARGPPPHV